MRPWVPAAGPPEAVFWWNERAYVCESVSEHLAKYRGSQKVVFWTTMGVIFGPLAIPFVLRSHSGAR